MQGKSTLPAELYREIFQHISKPDLCVLSRSSRVLQADAEFFIYQHIESNRRPETAQFCSLITKTTRFHSLVRTLHISNGDDPTIGSVEYWSGISALLGCLAHLEDLRIYDSLENPNAWVLASCRARLSKIGCDFLMDQYLASFFQSQANICRIDWTDSSRDTVAGNDIEKWAPEKSRLPPSATMLTTNSPRFALKMLGSSRLTHLWIYGPCAPPGEEEGWMHFIQNFRDIGTLRSLRLSLPHRRRPLISVLAHLAKYALNLRSLGFVTWFDAKVRITFFSRPPSF